MKKINILPPSIFNLLSAGEVVENPASIVKECVENSIDAGATHIEVSILQGGMTEILITDNGHGIAESEIEKVFAPHATSKIATERDLDKIVTLGFRGEAMSSIGQIAKVTLVSKPANQSVGIKLELDSGEVKTREKIAANVGTSICVRNIFYNTPARKKFLGSESKEKNNITSIMQGFILANPEITFNCIIDGKVMYDTSKYQTAGNTNCKLLEAIKLVYGDDVAGQVIKMESPSLNGYVSVPAFTKRNRSSQTVMINGRIIEGGVVADAVNSAFASYMISGNFPFFVLGFKVDFSKVDVNVHPRKAQVRFDDEESIFHLVKSSVSSAIDIWNYERNKELLKPSLKETRLDYEETKEQNIQDFFKKSDSVTATVDSEKEITEEVFSSKDKKILADVSFLASSGNNKRVASAPNIMNAIEKKYFDESESSNSGTQEELDGKVLKDETRVLGTIFDCYVLITAGKKFYIVDQHAAHERLIFDELKTSVDKNKVATQTLLDPYLLYLTPQELSHFENFIPNLEKVGFDVVIFGNNCLKISAVPLCLCTNKEVSIVPGNFLADIKRIPKTNTSDIIEEKLIMMSCKSAIKAGRTLTPEQVNFFIAQFKDGIKLACPHGRPIVVSFSKAEIEKLFARK